MGLWEFRGGFDFVSVVREDFLERGIFELSF